jgi:hypothetical protein
MFFKIARSAGCHWAKVHRSEKDRTISWRLMESESREAFNRSGGETGEEFNALVNPANEWDDVVSGISPTRLAWNSSKAKGDIYHNYLEY